MEREDCIVEGIDAKKMDIMGQVVVNKCHCH